MTTDNRTNGQAPERVEAAAVASINSHRSRAGLPTLATLDGVPNADEWRADARAALVAAQGAAPQAETDRSLEIAHELAKVHTFTMADGEAIARAALSLAVRALPSSGVDEDAAIQLVQDLAREAYEAYEDSSDNAYGAWSWLTERHEQMRAGRVLAGKESDR